MTGMLIGIVMGAMFLTLFNHSKKHSLVIKWWAWALTIIWFIYSGFVLKMAESFIVEGAIQAALVMTAIFGFISIVGAVLLARFVFSKSKSHE